MFCSFSLSGSVSRDHLGELDAVSILIDDYFVTSAFSVVFPSSPGNCVCATSRSNVTNAVVRCILNGLSFGLTPVTFPLVFSLTLCNRLPLHVGAGVRATAGKRIDMINHVAFARSFTRSSSRAGVLILEFNLGTLAALGAGVGVGNSQANCNRDKRRQSSQIHAIGPVC